MTDPNQKRPRLRHCTFVERNDWPGMMMIVGQNLFELEEEVGPREKFLEVKRYFDGRHSIAEIGRITGVAPSDIAAIVATFEEQGLMQERTPLERIPITEYVKRIRDSCVMWSRQIGYHRLFGMLERGEARKEIFVGLILETYHYVKSAARHISTALAHCNDARLEPILSSYHAAEHDHHLLILQSVEQLGICAEWAQSAHPIIGTLSLINMLCEIARRDTLAYLTCTALFEARREDFEQARHSMERICASYGFPVQAVQPLIEHMRMDVQAGHSSLLEEALSHREFITAADAHYAVNCVHDLKHAFDQFHDQVIQYYGDISNYIPRLKVDYFSL